MADITNLAESIGLGTSNRYTNTMPFTRAATTKLNYDLQEKRAEKEREREQARLQKAIMSKIKFNTQKLDDIGVEKLKNKYSEVIASGGDYNTAAEYEQIRQMELLASKAKFDQIKGLNNNLILLPEEAKVAFINNDKAKLELLSQNPSYGIIKDDDGRFLIENPKQKIDLNKKFQNDISILKSQEKNFVSTGKKPERINGRVFQEVTINPEAVNSIIANNLADDTFKENFFIQNQAEIEKEAKANGLDIEMAAINVLKKQYQPFTTTKMDVTARSSSGSNSGGGGLKSEKVNVVPIEGTDNEFNLYGNNMGDLSSREISIINNGVKSSVVGIPFRHIIEKDGTIKLKFFFTNDLGEKVVKEGVVSPEQVKADLTFSDNSYKIFKDSYKRITGKDLGETAKPKASVNPSKKSMAELMREAANKKSK